MQVTLGHSVSKGAMSHICIYKRKWRGSAVIEVIMTLHAPKIRHSCKLPRSRKSSIRQIRIYQNISKNCSFTWFKLVWQGYWIFIMGNVIQTSNSGGLRCWHHVGTGTWTIAVRATEWCHQLNSVTDFLFKWGRICKTPFAISHVYFISRFDLFVKTGIGSRKPQLSLQWTHTTVLAPQITGN